MGMASPDALRYTRIPLSQGSGAIPAVGFGTLIPDPVATKKATKTALEVGFRHFDCTERYRNEAAVGDALREVFKAGTIRREDVFVTTKLWNTNHRPERVKPAFDASCRRLQLDQLNRPRLDAAWRRVLYARASRHSMRRFDKWACEPKRPDAPAGATWPRLCFDDPERE
jgi:Aldo/keto reductase family